MPKIFDGLRWFLGDVRRVYVGLLVLFELVMTVDFVAGVIDLQSYSRQFLGGLALLSALMAPKTDK